MRWTNVWFYRQLKFLFAVLLLATAVVVKRPALRRREIRLESTERIVGDTWQAVSGGHWRTNFKDRRLAQLGCEIEPAAGALSLAVKGFHCLTWELTWLVWANFLQPVLVWDWPTYAPYAPSCTSCDWRRKLAGEWLQLHKEVCIPSIPVCGT